MHLRNFGVASLALLVLVASVARADEGGKLIRLEVAGEGTSDYCEDGWITVCTDIGMRKAADKAAREDAAGKAKDKCENEKRGEYVKILRERSPRYMMISGNTLKSTITVTAECRVPEDVASPSVRSSVTGRVASDSASAPVSAGSEDDIVVIDGKRFRVGANGRPEYLGPVSDDLDHEAGSAAE